MLTAAACLAALLGTSVRATPAVPVTTGSWEHAISAFLPPKYPPGFSHFEHVNPQAPQGGVLRLKNPDRRSSFDKFNPYTTKGVAPAGLQILMFEALASQSLDEPQAMYGQLAESMWVAPDLSSIQFRIHPKARFSNGDAVTPEDVVHSFTQLSSKEAAAYVQTEFAGIAGAAKVDARTVRFDLKERAVDTLFTIGGMPVFSKKWGAGKPFDKIIDEYPITSGPYVIDKVQRPSRVEFKRNPTYWAQGLPDRRGYFNFERVAYRMYKDDAVAREAFKAGEFDLMKEYRSRAWVRQHQGVKWRDGRILKNAFPVGTGQGLQSVYFNLRLPKFADIRVREALVLAWDFEQYNAYRTFKRGNSLFNNSPFAAQGEPSAAELALLASFRAELPARVFGPAFVAPSTAGSENGLRDNLKRARDLLAAAGWKVATDGKLRNAQGEAFEFQYLEPVSLGSNTMWQRNLAKLGITLTERLVDFALYSHRLEVFEFDVTGIAGRPFTLPSVAELQRQFNSADADKTGSDNYRGIKSRAIDHILDKLATASSMDELIAAARALDRVVLWSFYQLPTLYKADEPISYWSKLGVPQTSAQHFSADSLANSYSQPWPVWTWWDKTAPAAALPVAR